jgi:RimJ/RimL family protein N-acetyltransferase
VTAANGRPYQLELSVPVLETDRLILRGHSIGDFKRCASLWSDPLVIRYISGTPLSREECWSRLLRYVGHWAMLGFGYWIAEEKGSGAFVGEVGFADYKRELEPALPQVPEAGWVLASSAHGKGYATEALRAILAWGQANLPGDETICLIHPENQKSVRVAEKCGYRKQEMATYKGHPTMVFVRQWQNV